MAKFTQDRYNEIKVLCDEHKIDRKVRAQFEVASHLRYLRHAEKIICSDEDIIRAVNMEVDWHTFEKGPNWDENTFKQEDN